MAYVNGLNRFFMSLLFVILAANLLSRIGAAGLAALLSFRLFARWGNAVSAFAAGLLLTMACTHLVPEAVASGIDLHGAGIVLLVSFAFFLILECALSALGGHVHGVPKVRPVPALLGGGVRVVNDACCSQGTPAKVPVLLAGAACHSFVDGVLVAAAFSIDMQSGWFVTAAVFAHELPQVLGQIVILMQAGIDKRRAPWYVFASSMACLLGGAAGWALLTSLSWLIGYAMLVSAASFIFIVLGVLMPELTHSQREEGVRLPVGILASVLAGVAVSFLILQPLHEQMHMLTESSVIHEQTHGGAHSHAHVHDHAHEHEHEHDHDHDHAHEADHAHDLAAGSAAH